MFKRDPSHRALDFKKLAGTKNWYSVGIGMQYPAIGRLSQS